jgi:hypothetical protein
MKRAHGRSCPARRSITAQRHVIPTGCPSSVVTAHWTDRPSVPLLCPSNNRSTTLEWKRPASVGG